MQWYCAVFCFVLFVSGTTHDAEETVLTDYFTGSARKREFPEREKQFAHHATEGNNSLHADIVNI